MTKNITENNVKMTESDLHIKLSTATNPDMKAFIIADYVKDFDIEKPKSLLSSFYKAIANITSLATAIFCPTKLLSEKSTIVTQLAKGHNEINKKSILLNYLEHNHISQDELKSFLTANYITDKNLKAELLTAYFRNPEVNKGEPVEEHKLLEVANKIDLTLITTQQEDAANKYTRAINVARGNGLAGQATIAQEQPLPITHEEIALGLQAISLTTQNPNKASEILKSVNDDIIDTKPSTSVSSPRANSLQQQNNIER